MCFPPPLWLSEVNACRLPGPACSTSTFGTRAADGRASGAFPADAASAVGSNRRAASGAAASSRAP